VPVTAQCPTKALADQADAISYVHMQLACEAAIPANSSSLSIKLPVTIVGATTDPNNVWAGPSRQWTLTSAFQIDVDIDKDRSMAP